MTIEEIGQWMAGVLQGVSAPQSSQGVDALWAWQDAEGGSIHTNPLNTTWFMPGAVAWNTLPGGEHVWSYASVADAITATVLTLLTPDPAVGLPNGYDVIVANLRGSLPRAQWGNACPQLNKWGTGCGWITQAFGAFPGSLGGIDMTQDEHDALFAVRDALLGNPPAPGVAYLGYFRNLEAQVQQLLAGVGSGGGR